MSYYKVTIKNDLTDDVENIMFIDPMGVIWGIPKDENNTDYQRFLAWVAEGNKAEEWKPNGK